MQNPFNLLKEIKQSINGLMEFLQNKNNQNTQTADPRMVVEQIFKKGVKWFDYTDMSIERQRKYYHECQAALNSEAVNNIKNYLVATLSKGALEQFHPTENPFSLRDVQMTLNGFELLLEEMEKIPNPDQNKLPKDFNPNMD